MAPIHDLGRNNNTSASRQSPRSMAQSVGVPQRLRNEESWVEISSQPSSSSLSSIGDEIVTTGLRVQPNHKRRRRQPGVPSPVGIEARHTGSSQEEYEESESEEDQVMTSSNDAQQEYDADSDDENATALGKRTDPIFTPQPNAFSHPPSQRPMAPGSYFPRTQPIPPRHQDHDAALRASLTTLLSIGAAAARGLPKRQGNTVNEPMSLRFVPESELMGVPRPLTPSTRPRSTPSISSEEAIDKAKRKATPEKPRVAKKKKVALVEEAMISPTLLTWVMSAGVMVLVSVVGFGAGYVMGREVGRGESIGLNGTLDASCGREVVRSGSLRRFRWGSEVAKSIVA